MPRRGPKSGERASAQSGRHIPVLLSAVLEALQPKDGETYIDATFGAGGYARAILEAADCTVIAFDRDPTAIAAAAPMLAEFGDRLQLIQAPFGNLLEMTSATEPAVGSPPNTTSAVNTSLRSVEHGGVGKKKRSLPNTGLPSVGKKKIDAVVFDLGVSSMQIDQPERGFSFQADGPLDMRMGSLGLLELDLLKTAQARVEAGNTQASTSDKLTHQSEDRDSVVGSPPNIGLPNVGAQKENVGAQEASAADVVNTYEEADIAAILYHLGEERRSRAIAKAIVARRAQQLFTRTLDLANLVAKVLGRGPPGKNPATRTFQALRMYVNDELGQLVKGLAGAERALKPGGRLVVVTFHSLEDRIVKRFISSRSGKSEGVSRHMPPPDDSILPPSFQIINLRSLTSSKAELESNPRARSARLRFAVRTDADPWPVEAGDLGMPKLDV